MPDARGPDAHDDEIDNREQGLEDCGDKEEGGLELVHGGEDDFGEGEDDAEGGEGEDQAEGCAVDCTVRINIDCQQMRMWTAVAVERRRKGKYIHNLIRVVGASPAVRGFAVEVVVQVLGRGHADDGEDEVDCQDDELDDPEGDEVALLPHFVGVGGRHCDVVVLDIVRVCCLRGGRVGLQSVLFGCDVVFGISKTVRPD